MPPATLITSNAEDGALVQETLFRGIKFWIAQRLPSRKLYLEQVRLNGGQIVPLERNADILIADHFRQDCPPNSFSYTWIERSIAEGVLQDKVNHRAGPPAGYVRPVAALKSAKSSRSPYTAEDDRILYEWVTDCRSKGEKILGTEIYKRLEQQNPRHPWQSWRDRWIKYVSKKAPTASTTIETAPIQVAPSTTSERVRENDTITALLINSQKSPRPWSTERRTLDEEEIMGEDSHALPTSAHIQSISRDDQSIKENAQLNFVEKECNESPNRDVKNVDEYPRPRYRAKPRLYSPNDGQSMWRRSKVPKPFTEYQHKMLLDAQSDIESIPVSAYATAWIDFALAYPEHTAIEWQDYYESKVLPQVEAITEGEGANLDNGVEEFETPIDGPDGDELEVLPRAIGQVHKRESGQGVLPAIQRPPSPVAELNAPIANTNLLQPPLPKPNDTNQKHTLRGVVVPSLSPEQRVEYVTLRPAQATQTEMNLPNRKRDHPTVIQDESRGDSPWLDSKRQRLNIDSIGRSQRASSALADVTAAQFGAMNTGNIEVISILGSNDEQSAHTPTILPTEDIVNQRSNDGLEFDVYESHEIPEGEEENIVFNQSGSPSFQRHHTRIRSQDALVAFGDPPTDFKLIEQEPSSDEVWHDIAVLDGEQETMPFNQSETSGIQRTCLDSMDSSKSIDVAEQHSNETEYAMRNNENGEVYQKLNETAQSSKTNQGRTSTRVERMDENPSPTFEAYLDERGAYDCNDIALSRHTGELHVENMLEDDQDILAVDDKNGNGSLASSTGSVEDDRSQINMHQSISLTKRTYAESVQDEVNLSPDTPSKQLRVEMCDTVLRYSTEPEEDEEEQDQLEILGQVTRQNVPIYVDTQAIVEDDTADDNYLETPPPPEDYASEEDGLFVSEPVIPWSKSRSPNLQKLEHKNVEVSPTRYIDADTQAIFEANTQPLVLDEYPEQSIREQYVEAYENNFIETNLLAQPSSPVLASTPPRQTFESDDSAHIPSSPPFVQSIARLNRIRERTATPLQSSSKLQSTVSSTRSSKDPTEVFKACQRALGTSEEDISYALFRTTFNSRLAAQVLDSMRRGQGLPEGVRGIWTQEEDEIITGGDGKAMRMLEEKYGSRAYQERVEMLELYMALSDADE